MWIKTNLRNGNQYIENEIQVLLEISDDEVQILSVDWAVIIVDREPAPFRYEYFDDGHIGRMASRIRNWMSDMHIFDKDGLNMIKKDDLYIDQVIFEIAKLRDGYTGVYGSRTFPSHDSDVWCVMCYFADGDVNTTTATYYIDESYKPDEDDLLDLEDDYS